MKQKLGKATRLSVFFLTVAFLLQLGQLIYLMWKAVNLMEGGTLSQAIGLLQTETFVFIHRSVKEEERIADYRLLGHGCRNIHG